MNQMDRTLLSRPRAARMNEADRQAVADFLARNGARRFERGFSADAHGCREFLARRGYELKVRSSYRLYTIQKLGATDKPRTLKFAQVIAFIDQLRVAEGLTPIERAPA